MPTAVDPVKTVQYREVWCRICDSHEYWFDYIVLQ